MNQDEQQLRLLSIFHYVCAGMVALFACIPIIHLVLFMPSGTVLGVFSILLLMRPSVKALFESRPQPPVAA